MLATVKMLEALKKQPQTSPSTQIIENLREIKEICDRDYSNQSFYGNAALNRQMLLNKRIADLLTPEVLAYLFTNEPNPQTRINRNSGGPIALRDAIYYGFKDGLQVLRMMPNNEHNYGPKSYEEQKKKFADNTMRIVENIGKSAKGKKQDSVQEFSPAQLIKQYEQIVATTNLVKAANKSPQLLQVPGYTPDQMRSQVVRGFKALCQIIKTDKLDSLTLDDFCEKFLQSPEAMLDGTVIHLFYDRAHIEAALEQGTKFNFKGQECTFQDIFKVMVSKVATNPDNYPPCAKEQFCLRMSLVESDIKKRFHAEYIEAEKNLKEEKSDKKSGHSAESVDKAVVVNALKVEQLADSSKDVEKDSRQQALCNIVNQLINNIEKPTNGRRSSGIGSTKVEKLSNLVKQIQVCSADKWSVSESQFINQIQSVCKLRRNRMHFWKTPESVGELAALLKEHGFNETNENTPLIQNLKG